MLRRVQSTLRGLQGGSGGCMLATACWPTWAATNGRAWPSLPVRRGAKSGTYTSLVRSLIVYASPLDPLCLCLARTATLTGSLQGQEPAPACPARQLALRLLLNGAR